MKTFSIDYRSPPSGLGAIIDPDSDENGIIITYSGCGLEEDPNYTHTINFYDPAIEEDGWWGPIIPLLHQNLKSHGVTEVYDSEEGFNHPDKCDSRHHFKLQDWIDIVNRYC